METEKAWFIKKLAWLFWFKSICLKFNEKNYIKGFVSLRDSCKKFYWSVLGIAYYWKQDKNRKLQGYTIRNLHITGRNSYCHLYTFSWWTQERKWLDMDLDCWSSVRTGSGSSEFNWEELCLSSFRKEFLLSHLFNWGRIFVCLTYSIPGALMGDISLPVLAWSIPASVYRSWKHNKTWV